MIKNEPLLSEETLAKIKKEFTLSDEKAGTTPRAGKVWEELESLGLKMSDLESVIKELGTR